MLRTPPRVSEFLPIVYGLGFTDGVRNFRRILGPYSGCGGGVEEINLDERLSPPTFALSRVRRHHGRQLLRRGRPGRLRVQNTPTPPCSFKFDLEGANARRFANAHQNIQTIKQSITPSRRSYDLAFVTIFSMTAGNSWVASPSIKQYRIDCICKRGMARGV